MHTLTASTSFFGGKKFDDTRPKGKREVNAAQSVGVKEENSVQLIETKEVNSNESLNGSIKSVGVSNFYYRFWNTKCHLF